MFLNLEEAQVPMKLVYQLSEELRHDPEQVSLAQGLTKDESRPFLGLKGSHGLFGSEEWWKNILEGVLPVRLVSGVIKRLYASGQEKDDKKNTFDLYLSDNTTHAESIFANNEDDYKLFQLGHRVDMIYVLDELKMQPSPDGGINYSTIVLEMAVSLQSITSV